jgi:hypothetical protein
MKEQLLTERESVERAGGAPLGIGAAWETADPRKLYSGPELLDSATQLDGIDRLELMGGPTAQPGYFNVDLHATTGLRADVADLPSLVREGSVSTVVVNNPEAPFLAAAPDVLRSGGHLIVRGSSIEQAGPSAHAHGMTRPSRGRAFGWRLPKNAPTPVHATRITAPTARSSPKRWTPTS